MKLYVFKSAAMFALALLVFSCVDESPLYETELVGGLDVESEAMVTTSKAACFGRGLELVRLSGKVRYFGLDILAQPPVPRQRVGIPDVHVWLAEYPFTKMFNFRTDADGIWQMYVVKRRGQGLHVSVMYEKDHYPAQVEAMVFPDGIAQGWDKSLIKSNVYIVGSDDVTDFAMQMPDEIFLYYAKTSLENGLSEVIGAPYSIENLAVATVGKEWASIYDPTLPHGDPGAAAIMEPAASSPLSGPIYFDETVTPNPTIPVTSVDGGVLFNNLVPGRVSVTAVKDSFEYGTVQFEIDPSVNLYVASPPYSIQGNNTSGSGEM